MDENLQNTPPAETRHRYPVVPMAEIPPVAPRRIAGYRVAGQNISFYEGGLITSSWKENGRIFIEVRRFAGPPTEAAARAWFRLQKGGKNEN